MTHGYSLYVAGCRCDICKAAGREWWQKRKARLKRTIQEQK